MLGFNPDWTCARRADSIQMIANFSLGYLQIEITEKQNLFVFCFVFFSVFFLKQHHLFINLNFLSIAFHQYLIISVNAKRKKKRKKNIKRKLKHQLGNSWNDTCTELLQKNHYFAIFSARTEHTPTKKIFLWETFYRSHHTFSTHHSR